MSSFKWIHMRFSIPLACIVLFCSGCNGVEGALSNGLKVGSEYISGGNLGSMMRTALSSGNIEAVKEAVDAGADLDEITILGIPQSVLKYITESSNNTTIEIFKYLLEVGANPDYVDDAGTSLLMHQAGKYGYVKGDAALIGILLDYGADPNLTDRADHTALDYLVKMGAWGQYEDTVSFISHGAKVSQQTLTCAFEGVQACLDMYEYSAYMYCITAQQILQECVRQNTMFDIDPLLKAVTLGDSDAVIALLKQQSIPDSSALLIRELAIAFCDRTAIDALSSSGIKFVPLSQPDGVDIDHEHLKLAAASGNIEVAQYFIERRTPITSSVLAAACENNQYEMVKYLLEHPSVEQLALGDSLFELSAIKGDSGQIELLLSQGYVPDDITSYNAMRMAITAGHLDIISTYDQAGYNVRTSFDGETLIEVACQKGQLEIVKYLVAHGAQMIPECLLEAASSGCLETVKYVLDSGVSPSAVEQAQGNSPLIPAIEAGYFDIVKMLVESGADVNAKDVWSDGGFSTPIHAAAIQPSRRILQYLIDEGADVNSKNSNGKTPLDYAIGGGQEAALKAAGAIESAKNGAGEKNS